MEDEQRFADAIAEWTVDDFAQADPKLDVHRAADLPGALHVYERLAYAHLSVPVSGPRPVHLKSALPVSASAFTALHELFTRVSWPHGLSDEAAAEAQGDPPADG